jgi:Zn-finger nucleic acid-binding protein
MKCPTCPETNLVLSERQGIEIDYCPACRGVWLDRGELDKIIERAAATQESYRPEPYREAPPVAQQRPPQPMGSHKYHSKYHTAPYGKKKKATSFLGDIFDF